jgi:protoporphyrinogen oxidase
VQRVEAFWHEILDEEDFLMRPRMSRIYYNGKLYDYPLKASNALRNMGFVEATKCVLSYFWVRVKPPKDQSHFEGWVASRFGWRLYRIFFKTYTEKVWGIPATEIKADWAAQRIKNLSLGKAILGAFNLRKKNAKDVTSLIEEFQYPKYGPGMMWEACAKKVSGLGSNTNLNHKIVKLSKSSERSYEVTLEHDGHRQTLRAETVISTMAITQLVEILEPAPTSEVLLAARTLKHRDFLTVALVVPERFSFPDNWIYIHQSNVKLGRVQNFGSWSPYLVKEGLTCLGLEYFVNEGDETWNATDDELIETGKRELEILGLVEKGTVLNGYVVRQPKAYPVYDANYENSLGVLKRYIQSEWPKLYSVGRNGMHRYNNQDHSMLAAMVTVDSILGLSIADPWSVNVEEDYHETKQQS